MMKKYTGIDLFKRNFDQLRNHHQNLDQFVPATASWEKLKIDRLPDYILQVTRAVYAALGRGEECQMPG